MQTDMTVLAVVGFMMFVVGASALIGVGVESLIALRLFVVLIILIGLTQVGYALGVVFTKGKVSRIRWRLGMDGYLPSLCRSRSVCTGISRST